MPSAKIPQYIIRNSSLHYCGFFYETTVEISWTPPCKLNHVANPNQKHISLWQCRWIDRPADRLNGLIDIHSARYRNIYISMVHISIRQYFLAGAQWPTFFCIVSGPASGFAKWELSVWALGSISARKASGVSGFTMGSISAINVTNPS